MFRGLQGLGGGGLIVGTMAAIGDVVAPSERGRYQGMFGAVFGLSSMIGPLLGGFFTTSLSWRWIFYVNLPIGVLAFEVAAAVAAFAFALSWLLEQRPLRESVAAGSGIGESFAIPKTTDSLAEASRALTSLIGRDECRRLVERLAERAGRARRVAGAWAGDRISRQQRRRSGALAHAPA